ncbi:ribonuclease E [Haloactinospora alba]|uniref:Ribonuclease E n=1 Tax=Haloactinospora alba TaxID=405555 RepID=A0A543NKL8_9ACTN|nr:ribonuclease E/G [Haloactinospora alba]TQN32349.1 ribonuclease E [Haloactinospora alba]
MLDNEPNSGADDTVGTTETPESGRTTTSAPPQDTEVKVDLPGELSGAVRPPGPPPDPAPIDTGGAGPMTTLAGTGVPEVTVNSGGGDQREEESRPARASSPSVAPVTPEEPREEPDGGTHTRAAGAESSTTFQPPMVVFQPPTAGGTGNSTSGNGDSGTQEAEVSEDDTAEDGSDESVSTEESGEERPSRRRRRRGGRGRGRARSTAESTESVQGDEENPAGESDSEAGASDAQHREQDSSPVGSADQAESGDAAQGAESEETSASGRRRRRRRRRSASDNSDSSDNSAAEPQDDPPNTVVRVREPRAEKPAQEEVQAVKGSTRLEAKKQRRREGREQGRRRAPIITESEFLARREMVKRDLVIRRSGERTQIAVLEDDVLVEHYVDRAAHKTYVGNVYLGRVQNVLPSMEAAFVDIGKGRNAVLYAGEVNWDAIGMEGQPRRIESALKSGQSVLVQVTKDPMGHKGARLTSQVSLPGRYLVYVPDGTMTGISRKLPDKERQRLKQILKKVMPENAGVIVRTAAEGASEEELERDISRLANQWNSITRKSKSSTAPSLLSSEPDLTVRVVRDVFNEDFSSLVVSGEEAWNTVEEYVDYVAPHLSERLSRWEGDRDIFEAYRVEEQISKALERKVWLPSGGSLVFDRTEAMTVVDVNTGKFTGQGGNLEETVTKNNLEAAEEIVRQLRLRDIGGIIVIDFIDMVLESNRELVLRRMLECLSRDRTKHQVAEVTSLGLVQMTRKRVGQGLLEAFSHTCEHCNGRGLTFSAEPAAQSKGQGNGSGRKKKGKAGSDKADQQDAREEESSSRNDAEETPGEADPSAVETEKTQKSSAKGNSRKGKKSDSGAGSDGSAAKQASAKRSSRKSKKNTDGQDTGSGGSENTGEGTSTGDDAEASAADGETGEASGGSDRSRRRRTRRSKNTNASSDPTVVEAG